MNRLRQQPGGQLPPRRGRRRGLKPRHVQVASRGRGRVVPEEAVVGGGEVAPLLLQAALLGRVGVVFVVVVVEVGICADVKVGGDVG